jgi:hypothetical protein
VVWGPLVVLTTCNNTVAACDQQTAPLPVSMVHVTSRQHRSKSARYMWPADSTAPSQHGTCDQQTAPLQVSMVHVISRQHRCKSARYMWPTDSTAQVSTRSTGYSGIKLRIPQYRSVVCMNKAADCTSVLPLWNAIHSPYRAVKTLRLWYTNQSVNGA